MASAGGESRSANSPNRVEALITPALLVWARETAGFDIPMAAKKIGVQPDRLAGWEQGQRRPSIPQLRKLANVYRRPIAVFYLPKPPAAEALIRDFRRLPGTETPETSPRLRWEIRQARVRREIALDLYEQLGAPPPVLSPLGSATDDPETLATRMRDLLRIDDDVQTRWRNEREAFERWRGALGALGVLVFQSSRVPVTEMRGFSIADFPLPVVVINGGDTLHGRIFTMLHEFGHLMIHEAGLCDLSERSAASGQGQAIERFCNHVSGATLVPAHRLLNEDLVRANRDSPHWSDEAIATLARRFWVSREALLRRLLVLGRTTEAFYRRKRAQYQREYEARKERRAGGFAKPSQAVFSSAGPLYVSLVMGAYNSDRITANDLSEYLNVRLQHVPEIEEELARRSG